MTSFTDPLTVPARVAGPDEAVSLDELGLATRNHGMPLEALRHDVTPVGLHYLLVHYDIPFLDRDAWRLDVSGHVDRPLALGVEDLEARPSRTLRVTMECAGNGRARLAPRPVSQPWLDEAVGTAEWTGTPLLPLLAESRPRPGAVDVAFTGADRGIERGVEQDYSRGLSLEEVMGGDVLLAYAMNGRPLPPQHGAPVRLVVPGWYGMAHVKWLRRITVLDRAFDGFQNVTAYRLRRGDEPGEPVTRIRPRALLTPPGFPEFMTRTRVVTTGEHLLEGRAWSGLAPVGRVDVSTDGGDTWEQAVLESAPSRWAWSRWSHRWRADTPGVLQICCRATDAAGNVQPMAQPWNRQGMANNLVQRTNVVIREL